MAKIEKEIKINGVSYVPKGSEAAISNTKPFECENHPFIGKYCVVRTYSAGVWFGKIKFKLNKEVIVENARRIWRFQCPKSISLSAVVNYGLAKGSKLPKAVESVGLTETIELLPVKKEIKEQIINFEEAEQE